MKKISFSTLQKKYGGKYVLIDEKSGKIVAVSKNLGRALDKAEKKGFPLPFIQFVEPSNVIAIYEVSLRT